MYHARVVLRRTAVSVLACCALGCASMPALEVPTERLYRLPFAAGSAHVVIQMGPVPFVHWGRLRHAVDVAMPVGTSVLAARAGRVISLRSHGRRYGIFKGFAKHGNYVRIDHGDGTHGRYLHLRTDGVAVAEGDRVAQGQLLGWSGDTGRSMLPHLHFDVMRRSAQHGGRWRTIPVAFDEVPGDGRPRVLRRYLSANRGGR